MSAFKEQLNADLLNVFFSEFEEFWENVTVKTGVASKTIKGIFDNDELIRKTVKKVYQETAQNIVKEKKLLLCMASELIPEPTVNSKIIINNNTYTVIDCDNQMGLLIIQLDKNTQGASGGRV